jgi:hypothetical protein
VPTREFAIPVGRISYSVSTSGWISTIEEPLGVSSDSPSGSGGGGKRPKRFFAMSIVSAEVPAASALPLNGLVAHFWKRAHMIRRSSEQNQAQVDGQKRRPAGTSR